MATNRYFNHFSQFREQDLYEDLTIEAIKIYGHNIKYLPRTIVNQDDLFGEDALSKFDDAVDIEVYIKNVEGFEGEGELLSKFNLEIRDNITFIMARKRFDQSRTEKLVTEVGYNYLLESASTTTPSRAKLTESGEYDLIKLEDANGDNYSIIHERPMEGDLIYFPMVGKLFEIQFVEHENLFYQTGHLKTYELRCELFDYSHENLDTGVSEIDDIETTSSTDLLNFQLLTETGFALLNESGGSYLSEYEIKEVLEDQQPTANNTYFETMGDNIIDWSETSPFGETDRY